MTPAPASGREAGRVVVARLCEDFADQRAYYRSSEFDETTTRQRFIDPFFAALGWDVADEARRGPYADVFLEYSLSERKRAPASDREDAEDQRVETALAASEHPGAVGVRRPDYSFRLNGERRFFVEAKRPSVDIESPRPIYQVKSYGWSAGTPLAILTDFEQLLVFDCRYRPVLSEPQTGLLTEFRLGYESYIEHWDLLWDTFSREAVAAGAHGRLIGELAERKGQVPVDAAFLADLERWRVQLAKDLASNNPSLDVWQLNGATQLTLDRMVFVRVCEDRNLEPTEVLKPLLDIEDPYPALITALMPLRENYNGGLLDPDLADSLTVSSHVLKRIIQGLYMPWAPYRFDVLGVEILGSIYERALGSVLTLDKDRKVRIELKPEVRKAGGVYYTPQWVVDEIVRRTIDPLIEGKRPRDLRDFRVLDPACGSGSFLLGAFSRLIRHHEEYYTDHPTVDRRLHIESDSGVRRLTSEAKAALLRNSIFGVDVDPAAVEVTTMSLYLKSLESDAPEFVRHQMSFSGAILPSLTSNIRVGNSLVSTDYYQQAELGQLDAFEEHRLRPFKWESKREGFGGVIDSGGFAAVIGNPPYFSVDATYGVGHPVPKYLRQAYSDVWLDKTDIYYYFLRKAASLAQSRLGFIVSRAFLEADKAARIRSWIAANNRVERVVDFDGFMVFADAGIATSIVVLETGQPHGDNEVEVRRLSTGVVSTAEVIEGTRADSVPFESFARKATLDKRPWRFPNPMVDELYQRIDAAGEWLSSVCELGQGMQTGANNVFGRITESDIAQHDLPAEVLKPRARNSDIQSFYVRDSRESLLYLEDFKRYRDVPEAVRRYLEAEPNQSKLKARAAYKRGNCDWWKYTWPLHKDLHIGPRLISPYRTSHNRFAVDEEFNWATLTDTTVAFPRPDVDEDIRYLLGLLNTKLLTFRFRGLGKLTGHQLWEAFDNSLAELPIRRINFESPGDVEPHDRVVALSKQLEEAAVASEAGMSAADRSLAARRGEAAQDELDDIALDLYGIKEPEARRSILALGAVGGA